MIAWVVVWLMFGLRMLYCLEVFLWDGLVWCLVWCWVALCFGVASSFGVVCSANYSGCGLLLVLCYVLYLYWASDLFADLLLVWVWVGGWAFYCWGVFVWVLVCVVYVGLIVACLRLFGCLLFMYVFCGMIRVLGCGIGLLVSLWLWFNACCGLIVLLTW